jgi:hypothetical protein
MANGKLRMHRNGSFSNGSLRRSMRVLQQLEQHAAFLAQQATCVHARKTLDSSDPSVGTITRCLDCNKPIGVAGILVN